MSGKQPIRVLVAKTGLDGHNRGVRVIVQALRDAGMEVVYTGIRQTPQQIVEAALQEDVRVLGLSSLSGAHMHLFRRVAEELRKEGLSDLLLLCGGIIPKEDVLPLKEMGFSAVFGPGSTTGAIVQFIEQHVEP